MKKPSTLWLWVLLAFGLLLGAWGTLITIATKNSPREVPLQTAPPPKTTPFPR